MKYMIHACLQRGWYVREYLVPSMLAQGIPESDIEVWMDTERHGNLRSCVESFKSCRDRPGGTWHMQDDVLIAHDFAERTAAHDDGVVTTFYHRRWEDLPPTPGRVPAAYMWNSFPCIRIPNDIAAGFADWVYTDAANRPDLAPFVATGKKDDFLWRHYYLENYKDTWVFNIAPHVVEHIDWMIGGSVINKWRGHIARAELWEDAQAVEDLKNKLARR